MSRRQKQDLEILPHTVLQPGSILHYFHDPSRAEDDAERYWTEVVYDGLPNSKPFEVPRHWHKHHDEWWEVLEGRIEVYSEGELFVMSAGDPKKTSPRGTVHGVRMFAGERAVLKEKTMPTGKFKERFFRDLFLEPEPGFWYSMRAFKDGDTYPDLGLGVRWIDELFVLFFGILASLFVSVNRQGSSNAAHEKHKKAS